MVTPDFPSGFVVKKMPAKAEDAGSVPGSGRPDSPESLYSPGEEIATCCSILAWDNPWKEELGGL